MAPVRNGRATELEPDGRSRWRIRPRSCGQRHFSSQYDSSGEKPELKDTLAQARRYDPENSFLLTLIELTQSIKISYPIRAGDMVVGDLERGDDARIGEAESETRRISLSVNPLIARLVRLHGYPIIQRRRRLWSRSAIHARANAGPLAATRKLPGIYMHIVAVTGEACPIGDHFALS